MSTLALNAQVLEPDEPGTTPRRPLVILHGLFGSGANWRTLARRWSKTRAVHLLDARNHGASPHAPSMSYGEQAADLLAYLERHLDQVPVLLGHSMGGKTAMHVARCHAARLHALVVVDIAPVRYGDTESHLPLIDAIQALDLARCNSRRDADQALHEAIPDAGIRAFLLHNLTRKDSELAWRINLPVIRASLSELRDFPTTGTPYRGPTLILRGADSDYIEQDGNEHNGGDDGLAAFAEGFPGARIHSIEGAGHWVHAERPEQVFTEVQSFLESVDPR